MIEGRANVDLSAPRWLIFPIAATAIEYPFFYLNSEGTDLWALWRPQFNDNERLLVTSIEGFILQRPPDTPSFLKDTNAGVGAQMCYERQKSESTQLPLQTLRQGRGSCYDFARLKGQQILCPGLCF